MKTAYNEKPELNQDWNAFGIIADSKFPLVDLETRKKMASAMAVSLTNKYNKWYAVDEVEADAIFYLYEESEMIESQRGKFIIPDDEDGQKKAMYTACRRLIERELRKDRTYNGVDGYGFGKRVSLYNDEEDGYNEEIELEMIRQAENKNKYKD